MCILAPCNEFYSVSNESRSKNYVKYGCSMFIMFLMDGDKTQCISWLSPADRPLDAANEKQRDNCSGPFRQMVSWSSDFVTNLEDSQKC